MSGPLDWWTELPEDQNDLFLNRVMQLEPDANYETLVKAALSINREYFTTFGYHRTTRLMEHIAKVILEVIAHTTVPE